MPQRFLNDLNLGMILNGGVTLYMCLVFLWRLLFNRRTVSFNLVVFFSLPSVFVVSHPRFSDLHLIQTSTDFALRLGHQWNSSTRACASYISFLMPCLIVWFIWADTNSSKHPDLPLQYYYIIWHATSYLLVVEKLVPLHWRGCSPSDDSLLLALSKQYVMRSLMVLQNLLDALWMKLNTNIFFLFQLQRLEVEALFMVLIVAFSGAFVFSLRQHIVLKRSFLLFFKDSHLLWSSLYTFGFS